VYFRFGGYNIKLAANQQFSIQSHMSTKHIRKNNWCLQIFILSTHTSRLEHSACWKWNPSQVLVVWKRVSWSGRL